MDNAPAHTSMLASEFLAKNKSVIMPQPSCSLDLAPADYFLLPKLMIPMKGEYFATIEEIKEKKNRNRSCWRYQKMRFRSVSRIGKNAGISVLYLREGYFDRGQDSY